MITERSSLPRERRRRRVSAATLARGGAPDGAALPALPGRRAPEGCARDMQATRPDYACGVRGPTDRQKPTACPSRRESLAAT